jgi:HAD superfamily hydrolase (TIGR01450 family)
MTDTTPGLRGCPEPLACHYDTALLDLDGVVYVGPLAVEGAPEALRAARDLGMRLAFVTNNASRPPQTVADHLSDLGVPARADEVVTSAQAAARLVADRVPAGSAVLVVGGPGLHEALRERDLRPVTSADDAPAAVVQGFSPDMAWAQLAEGAYAVASGVPWIASNLDLTLPTARGTAPGNGTLINAIATATGRRPDDVAGKPQLALHREAVERSGARRPLVVGDRLDTDIEGANRAETDSLLVFTGVTGPRDLLAARPEHRPTYLAATLDALGAPQPEVTADGAGFRCGGWVASVDSGAVVLSGEGETYDGLRAACAAAWTAGRPADELDVGAALTTLGLDTWTPGGR